MFCFYCYDGGDTNSIDCCFVFTGIRDSRGDSQPNWLYIPCVQLFKICSSYENENSHLELSFVIKSETTIPLLGYPTICQSFRFLRCHHGEFRGKCASTPGRIFRLETAGEAITTYFHTAEIGES